MSKKQVYEIIFAVLLILLGLLLCMNTLFAYNYSINWDFGVVMPAVLGVACVMYALMLLMLEKPIIKNKRLRRLVIALVIICMLFFVTIEALIFIDPITHCSELAGDVDTVIVLGCGIWPDGEPTLSLSNRLDKALEYVEENPDVDIIVSGGQGSNEPFSEALAMEKYLIERGVPKQKIIKEDKSTSTKENFQLSRLLINKPADETVKIVFVTNDYHVLRSRILAKRFGFDAYAIPAPTPKVIIFNSYLREFFAFVKSMLVDY